MLLMNEDVMGGASTPMSTLNNTPGMGNATPPQSNSSGSGDKWGDSSLGPYTQKSNEEFYPSLDLVLNEENISPYDKIGSMMAKKMGVPLNFKKGKNTSASEVHQVNVEKPKNPKYKVKSKVKTKKINESYRLSGITYDIHPGPQGKIFAGEDGILGHSNVLIPWDIVKNLLSKYYH